MRGKWLGGVMAGLFAASLLCTGIAAAEGASEQETAPVWTANRMIAHAMGGIGGAAYTNSYEAFANNYDRGYRVFEVDLLLTEDGKLAARHDWSEDVQPGLPDDLLGDLPSLAEFKRSPILDKYHPLSFRDIAKLMHRYPDIYIVTDTKETDLERVKQQFEFIKQTADMIDKSILNRIVPELYSQEMYAEVMAIYPFPNKLYSLYLSHDSAAEVVDFVRREGIRTVAMPVDRALFNPFMVQQLSDMGVKTYVHAVNNPLEMKLMLSLGVYGVYSDFLANQPNYYTGYVVIPLPKNVMAALLYALLTALAASVLRKYFARQLHGIRPSGK